MILCAGALESPHLLLNSGIGDPTQLRQFGVTPLVDLPGVGENFHNHAPAYLINLYLATGKKEYADMLEDTFDTIEKYFPAFDESPFVQERFFEDWSHDKTYVGQQDRAVIGHNLKIAWNIMTHYAL